jgi:hypothetical protein
VGDDDMMMMMMMALMMMLVMMWVVIMMVMLAMLGMMVHGDGECDDVIILRVMYDGVAWRMMIYDDV